MCLGPVCVLGSGCVGSRAFTRLGVSATAGWSHVFPRGQSFRGSAGPRLCGWVEGGQGPQEDGRGRRAQGRPRGGASRQGWGRGSPAASLRRSWRRGGWPRTRTEPREGGRREEGGSRPAAMGPGAPGRRRLRLMSPLPPLPSVRALPLLLLLAGPGAAGEGPGPRGLDARWGGKGEQQSARTPESAGGGKLGSQGPKQGPGRRARGSLPVPGAWGSEWGEQGPRSPRHRSPGALGLRMKGLRSPGLRARG